MSSRKRSPGQVPLGTTLVKEFDVGWFEGTVASYDRKLEHYRIEYQDGDSEDMTRAELEALLQKKKKKRKSTPNKRKGSPATSPSPRRRKTTPKASPSRAAASELETAPTRAPRILKARGATESPSDRPVPRQRHTQPVVAPVVALKQSRQSPTAPKHEPEPNPEPEQEADLTGDYTNVALLLVLYILQGVPLGLTAAVSLSMSEMQLPLSDINLFSQVSWPFSLKMLWAPIVDSCFVSSVGLRKSWLIPTQLLIGIALWQGSSIVDKLFDVTDNGAIDVKTLTVIFFGLYFLCATQDICVDGWALTLLQKRNVGYASTCNAIGQTFGNLISYAGYIALDKYEIASLGEFMKFWSILFVAVTLFVALAIHEKPEADIPTISGAYKEMGIVLANPLMQQLLLVLFTCKIAFAPECMAQTMLVGQVEMPKEDFVWIGLLASPIMLLAPQLVAKYTASPRPFDLFTKLYPVRVLISVAAALLYWFAPRPWEPISAGSTTAITVYAVIIILSFLQCFVVETMFVGQMGLFSRISDPRLGGSYMTMLNTFGNMGSKWPTALFMWAVGHMSTESAEGSKASYDGFYVCCLAFSVVGILLLLISNRYINMLVTQPPEKWHARKM